MFLDPRTLLLAYSAISALLSFALIAAGLSQQRFRGPAWWGIGSLTNAVGTFLLALRDTVPDAISVLLANIVIFGAIAAMAYGTALYAGRRFAWELHAVLVGICMLGLGYFLYVEPSLTVRIVIASFGLALQIGHVMCLCRHAWRLTGHWSHLATVVVMVFGILILVARGTIALFGGNVDSLLAPGLLTAGSFYALMVFYIASAIGFLSMVASRLGVELGASLRQREQEALSDALTDTLNRRGGQIEGDRLFAWSIRHDRKLAALLIDLDHFKDVNDTFGHAVGDAALVLLAQCLKAHLRPEDRLARIGGEEFLVLLPETGLDGALILAERLRQTIARTEVPAVAAHVRMTASFGVAERAVGDRTMKEMLARADAALYRAKSSGRNRVEGPEATDTELAVGA